MPTPTSPYDDVPYESYAYPQSHPGHLATVAALFGMEPRVVESARVLEVGCAVGGNLLPLAAAYPGSEFVGVDISPVQIAKAREGVEALGLRNVILHTAGFDTLDEATAGGTFDYIIAHGVYSWVAAPERDQLLALCARLLNPDGVAYISYNTLPGSRARDTLRDMVFWHNGLPVRQATTLPARIGHARDLFGVLGEAFADNDGPYARAMAQELSTVGEMGDFYLAHEHLEETNYSCYFHEFIAHSQRHGLQYLGDAEMQTMAGPGIPREVKDKLRTLASSIEEAEQYHDFILNRSFRQTLLCRENIPLKRNIAAERVHHFHFASSLSPVNDDDDAFEWGDEAGIKMNVPDKMVRVALLELRAAWPNSIFFWDLLESATRRTGMPMDGEQAAILCIGLLTAYSATPAVEFHRFPPVFQTTVSERPVAAPIVRWQAAHSKWVTNLRHENLVLSPQDRAFITLLDGTRNLEALSQEAKNAPQALEQLARLALLVA